MNALTLNEEIQMAEMLAEDLDNEAIARHQSYDPVPDAPSGIKFRHRIELVVKNAEMLDAAAKKLSEAAAANLQAAKAIAAEID